MLFFPGARHDGGLQQVSQRFFLGLFKGFLAYMIGVLVPLPPRRST